MFFLQKKLGDLNDRFSVALRFRSALHSHIGLDSEDIYRREKVDAQVAEIGRRMCSVRAAIAAASTSEDEPRLYLEK